MDLDAADNLPPTDSDGADKDEDVVADTAAALLVLLLDVDPPSRQSQHEGQQGTCHLSPQAEDIMRHHPRRSISRPPVLEPHEEVCELECMLFMWF